MGWSHQTGPLHVEAELNLKHAHRCQLRWQRSYHLSQAPFFWWNRSFLDIWSNQCHFWGRSLQGLSLTDREAFLEHFQIDDVLIQLHWGCLDPLWMSEILFVMTLDSTNSAVAIFYCLIVSTVYWFSVLSTLISFSNSLIILVDFFALKVFISLLNYLIRLPLSLYTCSKEFFPHNYI